MELKLSDLAQRVKDMSAARQMGIDRVAVLIRRIEARPNEVNPYDAPRHLIKKPKKTRKQASARIQALYRSWKSRNRFTENNIKLQVDLEIEIPSKQTAVDEQRKTLKELQAEAADLEKELAEVQQNKASLG